MLILLQCANFTVKFSQEALIITQDNRACSFDQYTLSTLNINITQNNMNAQIIRPYVVNNFVEHCIYPETQIEMNIFKGSKKSISEIDLLTIIDDVESSEKYYDSQQQRININSKLMIVTIIVIAMFILICSLSYLYQYVKGKKQARQQQIGDIV